MWRADHFIRSGLGSLMPELMHLLLQSRLHSDYNLMMLERNFLCSFESKQFMLFRDEQQRPVGFVNWCFLSAPQLQHVFETRGVMPYDSWQAKGPVLFFPEFLAPSGHAKTMVQHLRTHVFPERQALAINGNALHKGSNKKVLQFSGVRCNRQRWSVEIENMIKAFDPFSPPTT